LSLSATTIVATTSSTTTSPRSPSATLLAGSPSGSGDHTWRRTLARAVSILVNRAGVSSSRVRHTVGGEATGPQHLSLVAQHVGIGDGLTTIGEHQRHIHEHLAPVMTRGNERRASAAPSSPVRAVRSANRLNPTLPQWATTPVPSPVTDKPADHEVRFTYGVPSRQEILNRRKSKFPLLGRHFRASTRRSPDHL
jgi:hypothetical protein